jgi:hypothetical protein
MKLNKTTIGWLIAGFFWSIFMGVTAFSIGFGALYPPLKYIAKPIVCPTGQLDYIQNVSNPLPGTTYTTAEWTCTDPQTGSQKTIDAIKMGVYAGPFYGVLLYAVIVLIWYIYATWGSIPAVSKTLSGLGIGSIVLFVVALTAWNLSPFITDFLPSPSPTLSPVAIPTDIPPVPTLESPAASAPTIETIDRSKAVHAADGLSLDEMAHEKYQASDLANPGTYVYTILMPRTAAPQWEYGWCATTSKILAANLKSIKLNFVLDGQTVPLSDFAVDDGPGSNGEQCHAWYVVLDQWPTGMHHLTTTATFTSKINDGKSYYPAGDYEQDYTVTVRP